MEQELNELVSGKRATWESGTLRHTSWTGAELVYEPAHDPWKIADDHPLTLKCNEAYEATFGQAPGQYDFWDFGTNAVVPVSMGIPTIGFGVGEYKLAHMRNECCHVEKIKDCCKFYTNLIHLL